MSRFGLKGEAMIVVEKTMQVARERLVTIGTGLRIAAAAQTMDGTGVGLLGVCGDWSSYRSIPGVLKNAIDHA